MNDDLISRKALIYNIRKVLHERRLFHICSGNEVFSLIMYEIDHAPTAFDKEKVIEELRSEAQRWHESGVEFKDENEKGVSAGFRLATHIVEKGGIE